MNKNININVQVKVVQSEGDIIQSLIGRTVKLSFTEFEYELIKGEKKRLLKQYKVADPEFEKEINAITSEYRIFAPGQMGTMDFISYRLNIYINESGIVTRADYG